MILVEPLKLSNIFLKWSNGLPSQYHNNLLSVHFADVIVCFSVLFCFLSFNKNIRKIDAIHAFCWHFYRFSSHFQCLYFVPTLNQIFSLHFILYLNFKHFILLSVVYRVISCSQFNRLLELKSAEHTFQFAEFQLITDNLLNLQFHSTDKESFVN